MQIYNGYEVSRSILTREWYAYPATDMTTCRGLSAKTPDELKRKIDQAVKEMRETNAQWVAA